MGIEPIFFAWKAKDLPLIYIRTPPRDFITASLCLVAPNDLMGAFLPWAVLFYRGSITALSH